MNLPWTMETIQDPVHKGRYAAIYDTKGNVITNFISVPWAHLIIKSVNSHDPLLSTLKTVRELFKDGSSTQQMIDETITQAEVKP